MSNLGNQELGDIILGGEGEEEEAASLYAHGQSQAWIKTTVYKHGQSQADIKQIYYGLGQSQALVGTIYYGLGQAQAWIENTYYGLGQAQGDIKQTYFGLGQSQGDIKQTYYAVGQAQGEIDDAGIITGHGQAQAFITGQYYQLRDDFSNRTFGPLTGSTTTASLSIDPVNYPPVGQYVDAFLFNDWEVVSNRMQSTSGFIDSSYLYTLANSSDVTAFFDFYADVYGPFEYVEIYYESVDGTKYTAAYYDAVDDEIGFYFDDDNNVIVSYPSLENGEAYRFLFSLNTDGVQKVKIWKLSDPEPTAWTLETTHPSFFIGQVALGVSHDNATIAWMDNLTVLVPGVPIAQRYGQAQAYIFTTTKHQHGQARTWIKRTGNNRSGQARAFIRNPRAYGQARARIKGLGLPRGQANALIKKVGWPRNGQANALISSRVKNIYGQAQALIFSEAKVQSGQANALITNPSYYLVDTFTRNLIGSLGTPDVGPVWEGYTEPPDPADLADVIVDGGKAYVEKDSIFYVFAWAKNAISIKDAELTTDIYSSVPLDNSQYIEFDLRANFFNLAVFVWYDYNDGHWGMQGFNPTVSPVYSGYGLIEPNRLYKVRFIVQGQRARFKVWDAEYPEPETWTIDATDSSFANTAGGTAFYIDRGGSTTPNPPDYVSLDNYIVKRAATEQSGQANALIIGAIQKFGQAQAYIKAIVSQSGQANALILAPFKYAQAQATIEQTYSIHGQARAFVIQKHRAFGQAQAQIKFSGSVFIGQAQGYITDSFYTRFGQAQAFISKRADTGQAQGQIKTSYTATGQAQAYIHYNFANGQAQGYIKGSPKKHGLAMAFIAKASGHGQAQALIAGTLGNNKSGQAQAYIFYANTVVTGLARAVIIKGNLSGQAQAYITAFGTVKRGNAQAMIKRASTKSGQAQGYIWTRGPATGQAAALIDAPKFLIRYHNYDLPGYAQEEHVDSIMDIFKEAVTYENGTLSEYVGLKNKILSLRMKTVGENYASVKSQVQRAYTMLRSSRGFTKLYIAQSDRYYLAMTQKISTEKTVGESMRTLDYSVEFETMPWKLSDTVYTFSGTGTITTVGRDITHGGWSPVRLILSGTNITVSGYTARGLDTGFISVSGFVQNLVIDSEAYTATINGESVNQIMYTPNYKMYVGPGETTFEITGATAAEISYQNRWYL